MEPYLDPYLVYSPKRGKEGYLVTSPEYSLKQSLSYGLEKVYEIAHVYRSGEKGSLHTREFLMLEFYQVGINEFELMEICIELFDYLEKNFRQIGFKKESCKKISILDLFQSHLGIGLSQEELHSFLSKNFKDFQDHAYRYEDLFFLVFLNFIEKNLPKEPVFLYHYPAELASLAKIEGNFARRFEIYWNQVELGNAFYELNDPIVQRQRFQAEQELRKELGKEVFSIDEKFLSCLKNLPECSGIAIGLDRLFMIFMQEESLAHISPYFIKEVE